MNILPKNQIKYKKSNAYKGKIYQNVIIIQVKIINQKTRNKACITTKRKKHATIPIKTYANKDLNIGNKKQKQGKPQIQKRLVDNKP